MRPKSSTPHYRILESREFIFEQLSRIITKRMAAKVDRMHSENYDIHQPANGTTTLVSWECPDAEKIILQNLYHSQQSRPTAGRFIVYSASFNSYATMECDSMGIHSLFDFRDSEDELLEVLATHHKGGSMMSKSARQAFHSGKGVFRSTLTSREFQVARLFVKGLTAKEVASSLHISFFTAKNHLRKVYQKMGISRVSQLAQQFRV